MGKLKCSIKYGRAHRVWYRSAEVKVVKDGRVDWKIHLYSDSPGYVDSRDSDRCRTRTRAYLEDKIDTINRQSGALQRCVDGGRGYELFYVWIDNWVGGSDSCLLILIEIIIDLPI